MKRLCLAALLVACGGSKPNQKNLAPLPADKPTEAKTEEKKPDAPPPEPPKPLPPLDVKVEVPVGTTKLVNAGKGKKAPIKFAAKAGDKQQVEFLIAFSQTASNGTDSGEQAVPPIQLTGEAETKSIDASGKTTYAFSVHAVDAKDAPNNAVPAEQFRKLIGSLANLVISGNVEANGSMSDTNLHIEKPDQYSAGAVDLLRTILPTFPSLPKEPVGVGAKWQTTTNVTLKPSGEAASGVELVHVTDYELVANKDKVWTIKSKTTITGKDQAMRGAKLTKIGGSGTSEIKLAEGSLYPTYTSQIESNLTLVPDDKPDHPETHGFKINGTIQAPGPVAITPKTEPVKDIVQPVKIEKKTK